MKIVVTGGSSGVGEALVRRLAGAEVWVVDVQGPKTAGTGVHFLKTDLSDPAAVDAAVASLPDRIDGLANVAGIARAELPETVVAVNFLALRHLSATLMGRLRPGGAVVNVSSIAGRDWRSRYDRLLPLLQTPDYAAGLDWCRQNRERLARDPYTFSKRAVTAYTLLAAQRALQLGVRINCVSPGPVETPLYPQFESLMGKAQSDWTKDQTGRAASPDDIAEVLEMLLTRPCGWLNGVDIPVDGGYSAGIETGWIDFASSPVMRQRQRDA
jgi:NAD(P)-dependent dehydrogenase (short-subunit alcohol dehydrogenase family)